MVLGDDGSWGLPDLEIHSFNAGDEISNDVTVVDEADERTLTIGAYQLDGFTETEITHLALHDPDKRTIDSMLVSWINRAFGSSMGGSPRKILLLGLGGGTLAHLALQSCPEALMDAVELNAAVLSAAESSFGLEKGCYEDRLRLHTGDAEAFIRNCHAENEVQREHGERSWQWDVILVDLYSNNSIPPNCCTKEFFQICESLLCADSKAGGIIAFNCGRDLEGFDALNHAAKSLVKQGVYVDTILPQAKDDHDEADECLIDNALVVLLKAPSEAVARDRMLSIQRDAGAYT